MGSKLHSLKFEVAEELGLVYGHNHQEYKNYLNTAKFEAARELGIPLQNGYNGDMTTRDAGRIGGTVGGKIGGNMVRKMIEFAEANL